MVAAGVLAAGCLHRKPKMEGFEAVVVSQDVRLLEQSLGGAQARYAASLLGLRDGATIDRAQWQVLYDGEEIAHGTEALNLSFDENGNAPLTLVLPVPYATNAKALAALDGKKKVKLTITYPASTGRNFDEILRVIDSLQLTANYSVATPADWKEGEDVIIAPAVSDEDAKSKFPKGWDAKTPYLRLTPQPNK